MWDHYPRRYSVPNVESRSSVVNQDLLLDTTEKRPSIYELARRHESSLIVTFIKFIHRYLEKILLFLRCPSKLIELERLMLAIPLLLIGAFRSSFFPSPHYTFHRALPELDPEHLVVLVHGLNANPRRMNEFADLIKLKYDSESVPALIHNAEANWGGVRSQFTTGDGILRGGSRLAQEVNDVLRLNPTLKKVSFIGHSLGGLYVRAAIPLIFSKVIVTDGKLSQQLSVGQDYAEKLSQQTRDLLVKNRKVQVYSETGAEPYIYLTANTPHVGVRDYFPLWFEYLATFVHGIYFIPSFIRPLLKLVGHILFKRIMGVEPEPCFPEEFGWYVTQGGYGNTVAELTLRDASPADPVLRDPGMPPLLARMATEDLYTRPLRCFKYRIACGVVAHDSIVPCCSQTLLPYIRAKFDVPEAGKEKLDGDATLLPRASHLIGVVDDANDFDLDNWSPSVGESTYFEDPTERLMRLSVSPVLRPAYNPLGANMKTASSLLKEQQQQQGFTERNSTQNNNINKRNSISEHSTYFSLRESFLLGHASEDGEDNKFVNNTNNQLGRAQACNTKTGYESGFGEVNNSLIIQQHNISSIHSSSNPNNNYHKGNEYCMNNKTDDYDNVLHKKIENTTKQQCNETKFQSELHCSSTTCNDDRNDQTTEYDKYYNCSQMTMPSFELPSLTSRLPSLFPSNFMPYNPLNNNPKTESKIPCCGSNPRSAHCSEDCDETGHVYGAFATDSVEYAAVDALRLNSGRWIHCLYEFGVRPWHRLSHNILPACRSWVQSAMLGLPGEGRDEQVALVAAWPVVEGSESFEDHLRRTVGGSAANGCPLVITSNHSSLERRHRRFSTVSKRPSMIKY